MGDLALSAFNTSFRRSLPPSVPSPKDWCLCCGTTVADAV